MHSNCSPAIQPPRRARRRRRRHADARNGAVIVLIAFILPVLIMLAAFAVNLAYMELVRSELRTSTDAAARAGSRTLSLTRDWDAAVAAAKDAASRNLVNGVPLLLVDSDLERGTAARSPSGGRFSYMASGDRPNTVQVTSRLDSTSQTGAVILPFSQVFSRSHFEVTERARATHIDRDIALILDRSGSMAYGVDEPSSMDGPPGGAALDWDWGQPAPPQSRWRDLVAATDAFLEKLESTPMEEMVSLSTFANTSQIEEDLTFDYARIQAAMDTHTQSFEGGATSISAGMEHGVQLLAERGANRAFAARTMVIMTDGNHNRGIDPADVIPRAQSYGITVHTVTFSDEADQQAMQYIAEQCHGKHWHAPTGDQLVEAFREIVDNIPTLLTH